MALSETSRQQLLKLIQDAYNLRQETQRLINVTTNPTEAARLELDLEKNEANIQRWEKALEGPPFADEISLIRAYLEMFWQEFEAGHFVKLPTWRADGDTTISLSQRRNLKRLEAFLQTEETMRLSARPKSPAQLAFKETSIEQALLEHKRILLFGPAGSGKTYTLLRLFQQFGQSWLRAADAPSSTGQSKVATEVRQLLVPLYASLSHWVDPEMELIRFLEEQITEVGVPAFGDLLPELMKQGRILFLLDGMDELPRLHRDPTSGVIDDPRVKAFSALDYIADWRDVACVVTYRGKSAIGGPSWPTLHLTELDRPQAVAFATAYYADDPQAQALSDSLFAGLYGTSDPYRQKLQGLIIRPFYLVKLLDYYQLHKTDGDSNEAALPDNPARLLKFSVNEALTREVESQRLTQTEADELQTWLAYLSFSMTEAEQKSGVNKNLANSWFYQFLKQSHKAGASISTDERAKISRFWKLAENAGFITDNDDALYFQFPALQEYFTALYCTSQPLDGSLLERTAQLRFREIWPLWAKLDRSLRDNLVNFIKENCGGRVCWDVATVLSYIADPRVIEPLGALLSDDNSQVRAKAVTALGRLGNSRSVALLSQAIKDADPRVRSSAITALSEFGEVAVRPITNALRDMDTGVRYSAAVALGKLGNPQSLNALLWIQQHDKSATANDTRVKEAIALAIERIRQRQGQPEASV